MNRLNNLIILYHIIKEGNDKSVHTRYYTEKCERYLGFIPSIYNLFKNAKHEDGFIKSDGFRNFDAIVDRFLDSNTLTRIDDINHITYATHLDKEVRIFGTSRHLAERVVKDVEALRENQRLMRDIKIKLIYS